MGTGPGRWCFGDRYVALVFGFGPAAVVEHSLIDSDRSAPFSLSCPLVELVHGVVARVVAVIVDSLLFSRFAARTSPGSFETVEMTPFEWAQVAVDDACTALNKLVAMVKEARHFKRARGAVQAARQRRNM